MTDGNDEKHCRLEHHPSEVVTRDCMCAAAYQMIRGFERGERRFFLSKGQFSLVDLAVALTHKIGRCDFACAVWTGTKASIDQIANLVDSDRIRQARWVLCDSQRSMNEERLNHIVRIFGVESVRVTPLHAKLMVLKNDDWSVVVQTSANMTLNRAVEQFDVTDSGKLCNHVTRFFDTIWSDIPPLSEEPPFDGWDYEQVESRYQDMCLGGHFEEADVMDAGPIGVADGLS